MVFTPFRNHVMKASDGIGKSAYFIDQADFYRFIPIENRSDIAHKLAGREHQFAELPWIDFRIGGDEINNAFLYFFKIGIRLRHTDNDAV